MRVEKINFGDYTALDDTRYIYNSGADIVRASERENRSYNWKNEQGFVTTSDVGSEYENDPKGLRTYDAGHLVLPAPDPTNTKVVLHVQSNNVKAVDTSGNRSVISFGSGNISPTSSTLNHPASSVNNILSFRPPKISDGVFRNLVGIDLESDVIVGDDKDFVIGGFYSEKHRRDMLAHVNSLTTGPSGKSLFLNDRDVIPTYIAGISEVRSTVHADSQDLISLNTLVDQTGVNAGSIKYINTISYLTTPSNDVTLDSMDEETGGDIKFIDSIVYITPGSDQITSVYDVWSDDSVSQNNLSGAANYSVGDLDYQSTIVPLITSQFEYLI